MPLFPELREEQECLFEEAIPGGSPFVITKWRDTEQNMRTHFLRIIFRAGLEQWPRLFHNLRGSRSNELFSEYPAHVASQWMGQSAKMAQEHYLHATDADIQRAIAPKETVDKPETAAKSNRAARAISPIGAETGGITVVIGAKESVGSLAIVSESDRMIVVTAEREPPKVEFEFRRIDEATMKERFAVHPAGS